MFECHGLRWLPEVEHDHSRNVDVCCWKVCFFQSGCADVGAILRASGYHSLLSVRVVITLAAVQMKRH